MAVVTYDVEDSVAHAGQTIIDSTDIAIVAAMSQQTGWAVSQVTPITAPGTGMTIAAGGGRAVLLGAASAAAGASVAVPASNPSYDRRDLITWDPVNGWVVTIGPYCAASGWTPASGVYGPRKAAVPAGAIGYGEVYVKAGATVLVAADCTDKSGEFAFTPNAVVPILSHSLFR
ncbi:MAG: hypothetical protein KGH75_04475 [Rhodospirillales bacterium]|nr:hypothetical protein [Rhodospirillales bacterium]